jgi:hypothetical protein
MTLRFGLVLFCCVASLLGKTPSADEIMQRVAANQDSAEELRSAYVYHQKVRVRSLDSKGKVRHEETSEYTVAPGPNGTKKELTARAGRYLQKGKYVTYQHRDTKCGENIFTCPEENPHDNIDMALVRDLGDQLTNDAKTKDGLADGMFPLTSDEIKKYTFRLKGEETRQNVRAYRIAFQPKPADEIAIDSEEGPWVGEALVSAEEFQPIEVVTRLAQKVPLAVKILLGTNLHGLGFTVRYQKVDGSTWFPVSYGTEFSVRVLFGWARTLTLALDNSGFQKADVNSTIRFAELK